MRSFSTYNLAIFGISRVFCRILRLCRFLFLTFCHLLSRLFCWLSRRFLFCFLLFFIRRRRLVLSSFNITKNPCFHIYDTRYTLFQLRLDFLLIWQFLSNMRNWYQNFIAIMHGQRNQVRCHLARGQLNCLNIFLDRSRYLFNLKSKFFNQFFI